MRIKYFNRYELKYVLPLSRIEAIGADLEAYLQRDAYNDESGRYRVTSLYYDTATYKAYWDKIEGHKYRRKLRVRVYGTEPVGPETDCFVEIKQRNNKSLQKKRIFVPYAAAEALCANAESIPQLPALSPADRAVQHEVQYLVGALQLTAACLVSYDRLAFNGGEHDPGLRVTFDTNLRCRIHALTLLSDQGGDNHFFLPPDWCIMEVKINNRVPYWLSELLGRHRCTLRRVSKYCAALEASKVLLQQSDMVT